MPINDGVGHSAVTPDKQEGFEAYVRLHLNIVRAVFQKNTGAWWMRKLATYYYVDTNAGSGSNQEEGVDGSPVIFHRAAKESGLDFKAWYIDRVIANTESLHACMDTSNSEQIYCGDNATLIPQISMVIPEKAYGLVYMDPNGVPNFDVLSEFSRKHPRMDILIRCSGTGVKRAMHGSGKRLFDFLASINKNRWLVRDILPSDPWQWTFLFGTNYTNWREWKGKRFYETNSARGREIMARLAFTQSELDAINQPHLDIIDNALERSGGVCEVCKTRQATECHHTSYRPERVINVCHACHCHIERRAQ